jgi:hypothetical protein
MKVYVKNVRTTNALYVVHALSDYGPISNYKLENGNGFVEFVNENDAKSCISDASFTLPKCMGIPFNVSKHQKKPKKKRKNYAGYDDIKFTLSSLELGNWGGRSSTFNQNSESDNLQFVFLSEWKYPEIYTQPTICFSKAEKAYLLEGFNTGFDFDETKRIRISYRTLLEDSYGIFLDKKDGVISLYISLKYPPHLYRKDKRWIRTTDWTGSSSNNVFENTFGRCLVYKLIFRNDIDLDELRDEIANLKLINPPKPESIVQCIEKSVYPIDYFENIIHQLPFRLFYKLSSLVSYGYLSLYEIEEKKLDERLKSLISGTYNNVNVENNNKHELEAIAWYALNQITIKDWNPFDIKRQDRPITDFDPAIRNFNNWHPSDPNFQLEDNFRGVWINHAIITPTKIYFNEPSYELSNRILRLYQEKTDRFLRVSFKEENSDKLFVNESDDLDVTVRIVTILKEGFYLAGRHYEFLAFSSSQLRDQSCWFVASDGEFNADYIRSKMGDFR